jgi:hypothetical protein
MPKQSRLREGDPLAILRFEEEVKIAGSAIYDLRTWLVYDLGKLAVPQYLSVFSKGGV